MFQKVEQEDIYVDNTRQKENQRSPGGPISE